MIMVQDVSRGHSISCQADYGFQGERRKTVKSFVLFCCCATYHLSEYMVAYKYYNT